MGASRRVKHLSTPMLHETHGAHCYLFDSEDRDGAFSYKAVGHSCVLRASRYGAFSPLFEAMAALRSGDAPVYPVEIGLRRLATEVNNQLIISTEMLWSSVYRKLPSDRPLRRAIDGGTPAERPRCPITEADEVQSQ